MSSSWYLRFPDFFPQWFCCKKSTCLASILTTTSRQQQQLACNFLWKNLCCCLLTKKTSKNHKQKKNNILRVACSCFFFRGILQLLLKKLKVFKWHCFFEKLEPEIHRPYPCEKINRGNMVQILRLIPRVTLWPIYTKKCWRLALSTVTCLHCGIFICNILYLMIVYTYTCSLNCQ